MCSKIVNDRRELLSFRSLSEDNSCVFVVTSTTIWCYYKIAVGSNVTELLISIFFIHRHIVNTIHDMSS
jgi:hypothetical protein